MVRTLPIAALAWGGPALALALGRLTSISPIAQVALAAGGALAGIALVLWVTRVRRPKLLAPSMNGHQHWDQVADPDGQYANRWASYQNLSAWLKDRDWKGKSIAEFGHTNGVLRSFMEGGCHVLLEYPEHDVQRLDRVESDRFDLAILDQTLEHVPDPERALGEVRRVLKPGGVAIVTTPFLVPLHPTRDYGDYTRWTPQGLATVLRRCGFEPEVYAWGNLVAARELLGSVHLTAAQAKSRKLMISEGECEAPYPVTVWAIATAQK